MPSLKDLRNRITSVKATQKITSAMKLVAASKLRRAQEQAEAGRPYAERMARMLSSLAQGVEGGGPRLMAGTGKDDVHLLLVVTSDRGLCGAFNASIVREARRQIQRLLSEGKTVKLLTVGRKGRDLLRRDYSALMVQSWEDVGRRRLAFSEAQTVAERILDLFEAGEFDVASIVYNRFRSAIAQIVTVQQVIPFSIPESSQQAADADELKALYEFEPNEEEILADLLPRNLSIQVYRSLLESAASEQGARMTAMDNATRNAGDMIGRLTLTYNRTRQANITKELIEIISGAEAV
ncbi:MAG: F0F1 ATP synthase subunit gamma [Rhodospirillales bacterium]|jgi:F-type H+-transporting ATPase subunit gamma